MFFRWRCEQKNLKRHSVIPSARGLATPRWLMMVCTRYVVLSRSVSPSNMDEYRQTLIAQMMEVTNCSQEVALDYLTRTNYDVETAVRHFFEGTIPAAITSSSSPSISTTSSSRTSLPGSPETSSPSRAGPVLPRYHSLVQFFAQFLTLPFRLPLIVLNYVYNFFMGKSEPVYAHIFEYISKEYPQYDSQKEAVFYKRRLTSLRSDLPTKQWRWLVTYIHDPSGNPDFFNSLFTSNFAEQVGSRGAAFFGCVMGSEDAQKLRPDRAFGKSRRSCIIIFVIKATSLTRKLIIEDLSNPEAVATNVDLALIDLIAEDADHMERNRQQNESRRLMEEQNREYEASVQRDLERRLEKEKKEEAVKKLREEEEEKQRQSEERLKTVQAYKKERMEEDASAEGAHDLLIRFPTGKKVIKFNSDDSTEKLFNEAMRSELCPLFFQMHLSFPKKPVPCLPQWYFDIVSAEELEPKEECLSNESTMADAGITHGSMVYIDNL
ncbi:hypothetical protein L3Y34_013307 [Caenorhabditis briggsae]|uniref:UBX domain-containing protein n=2 Tax=Caenorhabditis briggsae TaxID=6238 RepID=A0AAE8ZUL6_CAEBR|nr:hypothetical protein L3Y34_013307 [Caenorhabditis briggsae]